MTNPIPFSTNIRPSSKLQSIPENDDDINITLSKDTTDTKSIKSVASSSSSLTIKPKKSIKLSTPPSSPTDSQNISNLDTPPHPPSKSIRKVHFQDDVINEEEEEKEEEDPSNSDSDTTTKPPSPPLEKPSKFHHHHIHQIYYRDCQHLSDLYVECLNTSGIDKCDNSREVFLTDGSCRRCINDSNKSSDDGGSIKSDNSRGRVSVREALRNVIPGSWKKERSEERSESVVVHRRKKLDDGQTKVGEDEQGKNAE